MGGKQKGDRRLKMLAGCADDTVAVVSNLRAIRNTFRNSNAVRLMVEEIEEHFGKPLSEEERIQVCDQLAFRSIQSLWGKLDDSLLGIEGDVDKGTDAASLRSLVMTELDDSGADRATVAKMFDTTLANLRKALSRARKAKRR